MYIKTGKATIVWGKSYLPKSTMEGWWVDQAKYSIPDLTSPITGSYTWYVHMICTPETALCTSASLQFWCIFAQHNWKGTFWKAYMYTLDGLHVYYLLQTRCLYLNHVFELLMIYIMWYTCNIHGECSAWNLRKNLTSFSQRVWRQFNFCGKSNWTNVLFVMFLFPKICPK